MPDLPFVNTADVDVLVECFTEHTGELIYDSDCRAGRMLTDHDMFFVRDSAGRVHTHVLNADDYFAGCGEKADIPFVEPIMQVSQKACYLLTFTLAGVTVFRDKQYAAIVAWIGKLCVHLILE